MSHFIFSDRTDWSMQNNPLSIALEKFQAQGIDIMDLTESNPTRCGFDYPKAWLGDLTKWENLVYVPDSKGMLKARHSIADYYAQRNLKISADHLLLTSSTSEGYSYLLKLLTNPGDHVLIPKPSYPLFQFLLELHDVEFDYYPLCYDHGAWKIDQKAFKDLVTSKTKAVIVVNPNNPTCSYVSASDLNFLNEQCSKNQMAIISDEVFLDYKLDDQTKAQSLMENSKCLTFVLSGISKILALPQMKLSWIAANGPRDIVEQALQRLDIIADTYLSVNTPVQNAVGEWLKDAPQIQNQILGRVKGNWEILCRGVLQYAPTVKLLSVQGGWYAVIDVPSIGSEESFILELLEEHHVLVHPGFFFDFDRDGYLVLSLLPKPEVFAKALEQISSKIEVL